jgi:L-rhamnonate dehydratase
VVAVRIAAVEATCLNIPTTIPFANKPTSIGMVLVVVRTDDGIVGVGFSRGQHRNAVQEVINRELATFLAGKNPIETERIWKESFLELGFPYHVRTGILAQAISAVDQALWDIKGKFLGQPIFRLLGGATDTVEVYTTFGLPVLNRDELAEFARQLVSQGHDKLKMVLVAARQGIDIDEDIERVRLVREAVGDRVKIMLDANCTYSLLDAVKFCKRVERYDITFLEDPVYVKDTRLLAELRRQTHVPIAARPRGENLWDARELINSGAVDVMQVNVLDGGGYSESLKIAHMAEMYHLPLATGGAHYLLNAHLLAGARNGWMTENHLVLDSIWEKIFTGVPRPENGKLRLTEAPGLGVALKEAAVREYGALFQQQGDRDLEARKERMGPPPRPH